ncbi:hypothetical protein MA16_Dca017324 [Dendrobium catenatum]|uniref:Uncharacterized protein n=1 Tax=Dendrobium catenatum TaxID=906689 RepID=A0A2I0XG52_9ASPA|nr:hypothetical protein MA16_Dca017324 [Dendrobium catenatum]
MPRATKAYVVVLIPKSAHASLINYFRLISLCNVFYEMVAKMLANRMYNLFCLILITLVCLGL